MRAMQGDQRIPMTRAQLQGVVARLLNRCDLRRQQQVVLLDLGFSAQVLLEST